MLAEVFGLKKRKPVVFGFSMMLAQELLRAELQKRYGPEIKIFQCSMTATPPTQKTTLLSSYTSEEENLFRRGGCYVQSIFERSVEITALVGPFERLYPENPPEDRRRRLRKVQVECRMFSTSTSVVIWRPHFFSISVWLDNEGRKMDIFTCVYEDGFVIHHHPGTKNADNPCADMVENQPLHMHGVEK